MAWHESFNRSGLSKFLNTGAGRLFRAAAGIGFIAVGIACLDTTIGLIAIVWGILPLTAGGFDVCYISAALGGPLSGATIRGRYSPGQGPGDPGPQ